MTIEEIRAELDKMPAALSAAGWARVDVQFTVNANAGMHIYLKDWAEGVERFHFARGEDPAKCIKGAWEYIRALPDPQTTILATYSRKLADAIDYGHENNVPAKLVDPVRRAQKATSDMMLPAPTGAA